MGSTRGAMRGGVVDRFVAYVLYPRGASIALWTDSVDGGQFSTSLAVSGHDLDADVLYIFSANELILADLLQIRWERSVFL